MKRLYTEMWVGLRNVEVRGGVIGIGTGGWDVIKLGEKQSYSLGNYLMGKEYV